MGSPDTTTGQPTHITLYVRAVTLALVAVLALLGGLAVLQAVAGQRAADRLERSGDLVEAYLDLGRAVAQIDDLEDAITDDPSVGVSPRLLSLSAEIEASTLILREKGRKDDRALGSRIATVNDRYLASIQDFVRVARRGRADEAERIDEEVIDPASRALSNFSAQAGPRHAEDSLREIDALKRTQGRLFTWTLVAVPLALFVLLGLAAVLRSLRRRIDESQTRELARLESVALTDSLTGIGNHRAFEARLSEELARSARDGSDVALVLLDVDGLKSVNDSEGHPAGDQLIKGAAAALDEAVRVTDGAFRIGGDEFAAILPATGVPGAVRLLERLHGVLGGSPASVSAGVAAFNGGGDPAELIAEADAALLQAKRDGVPTVVYSDAVEHEGGPVARRHSPR